jgi:hypothetical protein
MTAAISNPQPRLLVGHYDLAAAPRSTTTKTLYFAIELVFGSPDVVWPTQLNSNKSQRTYTG